VGNYINVTPAGVCPTVGKADFLLNNIDAIEVSWADVPRTFEKVPSGHTLIFVVENGFFDAAMVADTKDELDYVWSTRRDDHRPCRVLLATDESLAACS